MFTTKGKNTAESYDEHILLTIVYILVRILVETTLLSIISNRFFF